MPNQDIQIIPRYITIAQACQYASLSDKTLYKMIKGGDIRARQTNGGHYRVDKESIDAWFAEPNKKVVAILKSLRL